MKYLIAILLLFSANQLFSQKAAELEFFRLSNDTVFLYLDNVGDITMKSNAELFRKARFEKTSFNYESKVEDYTMDNKIMYTSFYSNGNLNGNVTKYYPNGQVNYTGNFKNSLRDSTWLFYYPNGNKEKAVVYHEDTSYLKEFYAKNGKINFSDGNGEYKCSIISGYKQTVSYIISGDIKNGKFDGKWTRSGYGRITVEYFENGKFIKGNSYGDIYITNPRITLTGFDLHENVDIYKFRAIPSSNIRAFTFEQMLKYKNSNKLSSTLTPEISSHLMELNNRNNLFNYWCIVQFIVTKQNQLVNIDALSNNVQVSNDMKHYISTLSGFETAKPEGIAEDCAVYICIFCENGQVIIPDYDFNGRADIMNLLPGN
ncbi:MAG: hypothetical protein Q7U54_10650 [Bacteroidales bacterium]|nr:hypothetical protein [Bacteroidales bacterium]